MGHKALHCQQAWTRVPQSGLEKSSLVFVRTASATQSGSERREDPGAVPQYGLGLPTGTRLRARLESSASTAVRTPVLAVIEYNYERDGEIIVLAAAHAGLPVCGFFINSRHGDWKLAGVSEAALLS
jgi:hypothetical protein